MKQKNNENKVPHGFTSLGELENEFQRTLLEKMPIQPTEPGNFFTALFKQFFSKVEPKKIFAVITIDNDIFQDFLDVTNGHSGLTPKLLIAPPTLPYDYDFIILDLDSFREIETLGSNFKCNTRSPQGIGCCDGQTKQAPQQRGTWRDFRRAE
jgi:hypothetical protein